MEKALPLLVLAYLLLANGCAKSNAPTPRTPVVEKVQVQSVGAAPASAHALDQQLATRAPVIRALTTPATDPMKSATVTLKKTAILNREFLYSVVVQAAYDLEFHLSALTLTPARYRIVGNELQLVLDENHMYESDTNHPERLAHSFKILAQDADTLTFEARHASPLALSFLGSKARNAGLRTSWLRNASATEDGQYLFLETAVETNRSMVAELMESVFPRDLAVPANPNLIFDNQDLNPFGSRYNYLSDDPVWVEVPGKGRIKTSLAAHFHPAEGKTIDWYILPNVPDKLLPVFQSATEGWNRYSQAMWQRDIVRFRGKLPSGVKIGDPRYNVIQYNADSTETTGWESSANDPRTGVTVFAVVNVPKGRILSAERSWKSGLGKSLSAAAHRPAKERAKGTVLEEDGHAVALPGMTQEEFGLRYIKSVIFHEVGHALGFPHNFKGSLAHDPNDLESPISTSIMDYLNSEFRMRVFHDLESNQGPILEYDRQMLSVLYNGGKDVKEADPILPTCASEPDTAKAESIDPYCASYDTGKNPVETFWLAVDLLRDKNAMLSYTISLPKALELLAGRFDELKGEKDPTQNALSRASSLVTYYYMLVGQRFYDTTRWHYGADTDANHAKALEALRYSLQASKLEPATQQALKEYSESYLRWWDAQPENGALPEVERAAKRSLVSAEISRLESRASFSPQSLAIEALSDIKCLPKIPFLVNPTVDFEKEVLSTLYNYSAGIDLGTDQTGYYWDNRLAAAKNLRTCETNPNGKELIARAATAVAAAGKNTQKMDERAQLFSIYRALTGPVEEKKD